MSRRSVRLMTAALLMASGSAAHAADQAIEVLGKGWQVYVCDGPTPAWRLKAPDAVLVDAADKEVGSHFAGPSWRAADGSVVVGEPVIASPAPEQGAVPWLILRAKSHEGDGLFARVAFIARTRTTGGVAPALGCDASQRGAESRIPYTAVYTLFPQR